MRDEQNGFSLIEAMIVVIIASILAAMAIPMLKTSMDQSNANAAAQLIAQQLNLARALAVGTHSNILVQYDSTANTLVVAPGTGSVRGPFVLPGKVKLMTISPNQDTPDALGNTVLGTGNNSQITFLDNGSAATDNTGAVLCSGTFFVEHPSEDPATMRAVTLLGGTGRVRTWQYNSKTSTWQ
jgi:prepilin-type N-terminal cleavage/methylation domain-containing protein